MLVMNLDKEIYLLRLFSTSHEHYECSKGSREFLLSPSNFKIACLEDALIFAVNDNDRL